MEISSLIIIVSLVVTIGLFVMLISHSRRNLPSREESSLDAVGKNVERAERFFREELARSREEAAFTGRENREEMGRSFRDLGEALLKRLAEGTMAQKNQLDIFSSHLSSLTVQNREKLDRINETVESRLRMLLEDNARQLDRMRATVDEKLHDTLEKRLGDSFRIVSERLELVHRGLGEMQSLAAGVGDLKRVLSNVKTRGTFGEIQLHSLLEQILAPEQYECNVATRKGSSNRVEFAIRLPGRDASRECAVWLPVDAKFPQEDYLRLLDAQEQGNGAQVEETSKRLERSIREMARNVHDKYLDPPNTTDFAIMFLPTEGLYAEVLRRTGLVEVLQREYKVILTGPTTLAALLNSLQMGFRTLAVEKRASEVWTMLGAIKTEFSQFGNILDKTRKKLEEASHTIEKAARRTRVIEGKLKTVQALPVSEAASLLDSEADAPEVEATKDEEENTHGI